MEKYTASELAIASEFLTTWIPFLTHGLCNSCSATLSRRIAYLSPSLSDSKSTIEKESPPPPAAENSFDNSETGCCGTDHEEESAPAKMSWADIAQEEDELEEAASAVSLEKAVKKTATSELSRVEREQIRFLNVGRKKDFMCFERVKGKFVNVLEGLELHTGVFSAAEQKRIVDFVYDLQEKGRTGLLGERTYSEPNKWMPGKGRVTIQFGCCYNYATDRNGNPPGIIRDIIADPIPRLFKVIIRRLVKWCVLPTSCIPDSCIVNIYEPGDCIPPHIDSHDFVRPFTTVSFLSECNILFGTDLKIEGPGEFSATTAVALPVGSVLVLNGNAADVAKHCVPAVPTKRISITFRKMDESKKPFGFTPEPDLQNIQPLSYDTNLEESPAPAINGQLQQNKSRKPSSSRRRNSRRGKESTAETIESINCEPGSSTQSRNSSLHNPASAVHTNLPHHSIDVNSIASSNSSVSERRRGSESRSVEPPVISDLRQILRGSAQLNSKGETDNCSSEQEESNEPISRNVRMEHNRIVISSRRGDGLLETPSFITSQEPELSRARIRTIRGRKESKSWLR